MMVMMTTAMTTAMMMVMVMVMVVVTVMVMRRKGEEAKTLFGYFSCSSIQPAAASAGVKSALSAWSSDDDDADDETDDETDDNETDDDGDHDDCLIRFIVSHDSPVLSFHIRNFLIWPVPVEMEMEEKVICLRHNMLTTQYVNNTKC